MASDDIREFNFYFKYLWAPSDFEDLQDWLKEEMRGVSEGAYGKAVLSGCKATPGGGLNVDVSAGIAVDSTGRIVVIDAETVTVASPSGNPAKTLIVARPSTSDMTNIPEPINPSNTVPLHKLLTYSLVVINGTPAASPVYPAAQDNDIILMGLELDASHATVAVDDFDRSVISVPRKRVNAIRAVFGDYTMDSGDHHIEFDGSASGGTLVLPSAQDVPGEDFTVVKVDSGSNTMAVSGQGGDLISGESSWELDDQWQVFRLRSVGTGWRLV